MPRQPIGSIHEKRVKNGINYVMRVQVDGRRETITLKGADGWTRASAEAERQRVIAAITLGQWRSPRSVQPQRAAEDSDPTFHAFATEWWEGHGPTLRPRSQEDYLGSLSNHLLPFFAGHRLSEITKREVDRYIAFKVNEAALGGQALNKTLLRLTQILERAVDYDLIPANPATKRRVKAGAPRRQWLEPEQVKPLLDSVGRGLRGGHVAPDVRTCSLFATAICAGLRISELMALRWRDVDLKGGKLRVRDSKTEAGIRTVYLWPELREELIAYKLASHSTQSHAYVFGTSTGNPDTRHNVIKRLHRAVKRANTRLDADGLPPIPERLTNHDLRRTFAYLMYARGNQPDFVMDQLGHTDAKLALQVYAKTSGLRQERAGMILTLVIDGARWIPIGHAVADQARASGSPPASA